MAPKIPFLLLLLIVVAGAVAFAFAFAGNPQTGDDLVAELRSLRDKSPSGVIRLDDRAVNRFLTSAPSRTYSLLVFFDAQHLHSKPDLHLPHLRSEFALLSASFALHHSGDPSATDRLFFCDIEFGESQSSFALFGVNSLPHVRLVPPSAKSLRDESVQMDQSDIGRGADSMAEFVEARTKISIGGPIVRPPPFSAKQIGLLLAAVLVVSPFLIRRVLAGDTLIHDKRLWAAMALFVYFFGVSGTMHNIIRNMPMMLPDRNNPGQLIFFYQGSGMQLGAEGFAVGSLYMIVGLILAFVTHWLAQVRSVASQRLFMVVGMVIAYWAVGKVIYLDNWKTGYSIHAFWPTRWR